MPGAAAIQQRNTELVDVLSADLQRRYEPNFVWGNVISLYTMLLSLRGFWPFSSVDENGALYDMSNQGRTLTNNGATPFAQYGLALYANLTPGSTQYFYRADEPGLDITGAVTLGGWYWVDTLAPGNNMGLIGKWTATGNQRSYLLYFNDTTNTPSFKVSSDGTVETNVNHTTALVTGTWYHIAGRYNPSTAIDVFLNGVKTTNAVGIPAAIFNSTASLRIGSYVDAGNNLLDGRATLNFLCAAALSDATIKAVYEHTRALFGV